MDQEAIKRVVKGSNPMDYVLSRGCSEDLGEQLLRYKKSVEGRRIIEIGSARTGILPHVVQLEVPSYVGVDPFAVNATTSVIEEFLKDNPQYAGMFSAESEDALTFLRSQPTESATVVSSGVLDFSVIGGKIHNDPDVAQYQRELSSEIYRVTPVNGISYHRCADREWQEALVSAGFKADEISDFLFLKESQ